MQLQLGLNEQKRCCELRNGRKCFHVTKQVYSYLDVFHRPNSYRFNSSCCCCCCCSSGEVKFCWEKVNDNEGPSPCNVPAIHPAVIGNSGLAFFLVVVSPFLFDIVIVVLVLKHARCCRLSVAGCRLQIVRWWWIILRLYVLRIRCSIWTTHAVRAQKWIKQQTTACGENTVVDSRYVYCV